METLAFPIRIDRDGRLERTDPASSLISVIRAMAASPPETWRHAPWFGLQEVFAGVNPRLEDQPVVADALNRALAELGIGWARVESLRLAQDTPPGVREFRFTLATPDGLLHRSVRL